MRNRVGLHLACLAVTAFVGVPIYLVALAAFTSRTALNEFPVPLGPTDVSTETMRGFLATTGVTGGFLNSLMVGLATVVLTLYGVVL